MFSVVAVVIFTFSFIHSFIYFFLSLVCRVEVLPISKKIIDISKRLISDGMADSNENTKIELYKDGIIVTGSVYGIKVSRDCIDTGMTNKMYIFLCT